MAKTALVCGAGGFIGSHMVRRLVSEGYHVTGADLKLPEFSKTAAHAFHVGDLRDKSFVERIMQPYDEVYQFAADMGGAGYIFTGDNDANVMNNSASINLNFAEACSKYKAGKVFYSSSACVYSDKGAYSLKETDAIPADPDSAYGWEKLFSERLYNAYAKNFGLNIRVARFHNIFGPEGTYKGGKEKAPAAICRKVAACSGEIEIWGDGRQTRSFLYIDECIEGVRRLMASNYTGVINIGSDEMISINDLAKMVIDISGKQVRINNVPGPIGVSGRNSDNLLIKKTLGWAPSSLLREGMEKTYCWINEQL